MKHISLFLLFLLFLHPLKAQNAAQNSFKTAMDTMLKHPENYLAPVKAISGIKTDSTDFNSLNTWLQAMMTYYSFLGDYQQVLFYSDNRFKDQINTQKVEYDTTFVKEHTFVNADAYITWQASRQQVIMINEAHHLPFHRAFVLPMLEQFYKAGYRYLAIETLEDSLINQKKYPDFSTGYYTNEPLFGEMIREAMRLHFKLINYEATEPCNVKTNDPYYCSRFRDSIMAVKLAGILKSDPKAKLLVYAGYDHIHEGSETSWKKMAQFFKEFTGIDPYTVELTRQVEHLYPQLNHKEFAAVNKFKHITKPVIALKDNTPWHGEFVDATVIFPQYLVKGKRPSYNSIDGLRKFYSLDSLHLKIGQFVQAFYDNEKPGYRIPADQLVISDSENCLYLFEGKYSLEIKNGEGALIKKDIINIK